MRILLIDDDVTLCNGIKRKLEAEGMCCDVENSGLKGLDQAKSGTYDLIILDLSLPDAEGLEILQRCRMNHLETPVIILTSQNEMKHKIHGFEKGADDYLPKPFNVQELLARIQAIVRRSKGYATSIIKAGLLELDLKEKTLCAAGKKIDLTNTEYKILELLMLHKGSTLHKDIFFEYIYSGSIEVPEAKIIDVFVCKIRKKLIDACGFDLNYIQTVWGRGYVLEVPDEADYQEANAS